MKRLYKFLRPYYGNIVLLVIAICIKSFTDLQLPRILGDIVNIAIAHQDGSYIFERGSLMLFVSLISGGAAITVTYLSVKISTSFGKSMRDAIYSKVQRLSIKEFDELGTASLITRSTNDVQQVQSVTMSMLRTVLAAPIMCIGGIIMAFTTDSSLSIILIVFVPLLLGIKFFAACITVPMFKLIQLKMDAMNLVMREKLNGIRVVRAFNKEQYEKVRFDKNNIEYCNTNTKVHRISNAISPISMLIMNITTIAIAWFGAKNVFAGYSNVGNLVAFIQYSGQIFSSISLISMMFTMIPRALASYQRIHDILNKEETILNSNNSTFLNDKTINFKNVSFRYGSNQQHALRDVSFTAKKGEITAIVGSTGSGKSSVFNLLQRFYNVSNGNVTIGGININDLNIESLRKIIGYVPQKAVLFSGSIRDNLIFGCDKKSDDELWDILKKVQAFDFVSQYEDGLNHPILQDGKNLSGGQKQRLSIARACLVNPDIYLLDDCFSALDFTTDKKCREAIAPILSDSIVLIVAQRLSTVLHADQILVFENGEIVGRGTHTKLKETCSQYFELLRSQVTQEEAV